MRHRALHGRLDAHGRVARLRLATQVGRCCAFLISLGALPVAAQPSLDATSLRLSPHPGAVLAVPGTATAAPWEWQVSSALIYTSKPLSVVATDAGDEHFLAVETLLRQELHASVALLEALDVAVALPWAWVSPRGRRPRTARTSRLRRVWRWVICGWG